MKLKRFLFASILFLCGCQTLVIPHDFVYKEIETNTFKLASWQKITNPKAKFKVYIEGDGASFDAYGMPTANPTPKNINFRKMAFGDFSPNVIYLARPCQFVKDDMCSQRHWTDARFAVEVVSATYEAIKNIVKDNDVVLIGFSGGAQVAGLVSVARKGLNVKKLITIGGNLDHIAWSRHHKIRGLNQSLNLADYRDEYMKIPQIHYVGENDKVITPELVYDFVKDNSLVYVVDGATHNSGWEEIYPVVWGD